MNVHIRLLNNGKNDHHRIEAIFKAFARAVRMAVSIDEKRKEDIPSTKGVL
jgi:imidazoleglycerol-phosphate dehydratase